MSRVAPHKRDLLSLYWSHYWSYDRYLASGSITEKETHERLFQLDSLWNKLSQGAKKVVDPLWEREEGGAGCGWQELRALRCPNCGWVIYVSPGSGGPPRCPICMKDVCVSTRDEEIKQKLEDLRKEKEKILDEVFRTHDGKLANLLLEQVNVEMDNLQKLQAHMKGQGIG